MKILIVDDDEKITKVLAAYLTKENYLPVFAATGPEGLSKFRSEKPDLILLDVMLPGLSGIEVCRVLRQESSVPILMLTARDGEDDRISGLELGADDYITKPFSPRELIARIKAVFRRTQASAAASAGLPLLTLGSLVLDEGGHTASAGEAPLALTPTEFNLLAAFMRHPGQVLSRQQLMTAAQEDFFEGYERTIDSHIKNLRKKLNLTSSDLGYIQTVYGVGYRMKESEEERG